MKQVGGGGSSTEIDTGTMLGSDIHQQTKPDSIYLMISR